MKKYTLTYVSGATCFGWEKEYDRIEEFESFVDEMRAEYTASVTVWDNEIQKFIYWKNCLTYKAKVDMLHSYKRDLRTTSRERK